MNGDDDKVHWLGRLGLLARGAVYAIVGLLSFKLAIGDGGKTADQQGAMLKLSNEPFGTAMLIALAVGLAAYSVWRFAGALGRDDGFKDRATALLSGLMYGGLCVLAVSILIEAGLDGGGAEDDVTRKVFDYEYGRQIIGGIGVVIVLEGIAQVFTGVKRKFCEQSRTENMHAVTEKVFVAVGVAGYCARGVVFGLIGAFLIKAAVEYDPDEAIALDGALAKVADATAGPFLLGTVAVGLMAFAVYCVFDSVYRRL